jgi:hypothetical protein
VQIGSSAAITAKNRFSSATHAMEGRSSKRRAGCGNVTAMAGNVVNLNRFRKKKLREEKAKLAEINRVRHGRTQAQRDRENADRERAARMLEGKRLEEAKEGVSGDVPPEPDEPNERP